MGYDYQINHIAGEDHVWADLLSLWGSSLTSICAIKITHVVKSPQLDESFVWPTFDEIKSLQAAFALDGSRSGDGLVVNERGKIIVPEGADSLQLRLCIIAHGGAAGHQGLQNTFDSVAEFFWWSTMKEDVERFVRSCLHCVSTRGGKVISRPLGEQIHATKPNEVLHWDFLYLEPGDHGMKYVLVLKHDTSKYVWIKPCRGADAITVYDCLMEWFAAFGICYTWVSDQGSHFKNQIIASLQHALGSHHHFTTARCHWANGTVEVVNRSILRVFRALLSEWRMKSSEWVSCAPIVQLVLNNTRLESLAGEAPITCMTGLSPSSPLAPIITNSDADATTIEEIEQIKKVKLAQLIQSLDAMHKKVEKSAKKNRGRAKTRSKAISPNFDVGDFVLQATLEDSTRGKLQVVRKGPARILCVVSPWFYEVEDMITKHEKEVHASRLKFYHDGSLEITEDLIKQVAHSQEGYEVESFGLVRYNDNKNYEMEIKWRGLSEKENSFEPVKNIMEDVPLAFQKHLKKLRKDDVVVKMFSALDWRLS
jgi:hypothetical protein